MKNHKVRIIENNQNFVREYFGKPALDELMLEAIKHRE
jgi:hypothetical protein